MSSTPLAPDRRRVDYDPRGHGHGIVPFITAWSTEHPTHPPVVIRSDGVGIGYRSETLGDRDAEGVLWLRIAHRLGEGKPLFGSVHTTRQRIAMRHLLCQVCARPADTSEDGVLWLLPDLRIAASSRRQDIEATEPPICRPCLTLSTRFCPRLRQGHTLIRARSHDLTGIHGVHYLPTPPTPTPAGSRFANLDEPVISWMRAGQLTRTLRSYTTITP